MFIKPFRIKSSSQMKGSDKKKFKANLRKRFPGLEEDPDLLDQLLPQKEDMTLTKIYTYGGESVLVYSLGPEPLFFEHDKQKALFPTVYALWRCPLILERVSFTTLNPVVARLQNGADLMLPGVVADVSTLGMKAFGGGRLKKDDPAMVNLVSNRAAIAVGSASQGSEDLYMQAGRGKAVRILHCIGDNLYLMGSKDPIPDLGQPEGLDFLKAAGTEMDDLEEAMNDEGEEDLEESNDNQEDEAVVEELDEKIDDLEIDDRDPQEIMDELIENAFLQALKTTAKKVELPILTSNFYRVHMVPAAGTRPLDLKKSSFKKMSKFLAKMQEEGLIKVKEQKKGVEVISEINHDHEKVIRFKAVKLEVPQNQDGGQKATFKPPIVTEINFVTAQVATFFKECGLAKGDAITTLEVRECVKEYVKKEGLQNPQDPSVINVDPVLAEAALVKGENGVFNIRWDKVTSRITTKMSRGYTMDFQDGRKPQVFKGKLEPIEMLLASRSGNKKVTLIHNLDVYGIDLNEFAHKCQIGVAASTAIHEANNKKRAGGQPVMEVLVQGNQVAFASNLLLNDYKIPRKHVKGMELAAKGKKGK